MDRAESESRSDITLTIGQRYDTAELVLVGWTDGDGTATDGYRWHDYFCDGVYLGPDEHGIEPCFEN